MAMPEGWLGQSHNFLGIGEPWCTPSQAGVYVLPAPYEHTSSYILGSDRGPSAILEASSQVEFYDEQLRCEPYREWGGIATASALDLGGKVDRDAVDSGGAAAPRWTGAVRAPDSSPCRFVTTVPSGIAASGMERMM